MRRSVANHLNDIGKDHPAVLTATAERWLVDATPERRWIVGHALRSAVKRGDPAALAVLGYGRAPRIDVREPSITPARVAFGGEVRIRAEVHNPGRRRQRLLLDLQIDYVKARGHRSPKVFKLTTLDLGPGETASLAKTLSLAERTTRRHHPGHHAVRLLVNGQALPLGSFELLAAG